ncbi:MAG: FAD-binding oxidoreductase [Chloroflexota bacterium]
MTFARSAKLRSIDSLKEIKNFPYWLDDSARPEPQNPLTADIQTDLLIIGGGFTGLWTALLAKQAEPRREVVLIEGNECGTGASGRNGGFMAASLTHGFENGYKHWPSEIETLLKMGYENLNEIENTIQLFNIDCDFIRSGEITAAIEPYQVDEMREIPAKTSIYGGKFTWIEKEELAKIVKSPTYLGALLNPYVAMVNPARLAWGLKRACLELGVRLYENTHALKITDKNDEITVITANGKITARKTALATNAFPPLLNRIRHYVVPVYDYALMTEPLNTSQRDSIGWLDRQGLADGANQFHYYRITVDGRILWGGYDAVYYKNNGFGTDFEKNQETFERLAEHFFETFPQLEGVKFTHAWGGAIDTCSRFCSFWDSAHNGKTVYCLGFTGLGVGAARFGANVMLDLLDGKKTKRTELEMVKNKPVPFPPEPFRFPIINLTRYSLNQADQNQGKRNLWLKILDMLDLGFDS